MDFLSRELSSPNSLFLTGKFGISLSENLVHYDEPLCIKALYRKSNALWKWLYVGGILVSGLAEAFSFQPKILGWILIIIGILVGVFYFDPENFLEFGVIYIVLGIASSALNSLIAIGPLLTGFFNGALTFLGPVALTVLVTLFVKKNF